ncbi:RadC family protein [Colwellia sp. 20A7]|uniref:RadC family protein n=1 Tax=Colwellia sp. 20A7 TaxID=2689569 RepID=UPI001358FAE6|nr:DNA repair protein RadC [Colwellia sp. 20A7]
MHTKTTTNWSQTAMQILETAANIIADKYLHEDVFCNSQATKEYLSYKLNGHEVFAVLLLNNQHELIEYKELFYGTVGSCAVYPREVVKAVIQVNAAAVILAHNHPSGISEPSQADKDITQRLVNALGLIDVRVLDHLIIGKTVMSFAESNLLPVASTIIN